MTDEPSKDSAVTPTLTKVNLVLGGIFVVVAVAYFVTASNAAIHAFLDAPAAISAWTYLFLTPVLGLVARFSYPNARRTWTNATLLVWFVVLVFLGFTGIRS